MALHGATADIDCRRGVLLEWAGKTPRTNHWQPELEAHSAKGKPSQSTATSTSDSNFGIQFRISYQIMNNTAPKLIFN